MVVYKYCKPTTNYMNNFLNDAIWGTSPVEFNDIFDTQFFYDSNKIEEYLKNRISSYTRIPKEDPQCVILAEWLCRSEKHHIDRVLREFLHISCFSEQNDIPSMWAHYTDFNRGFVLAYETDTFKQGSFVKVEYGNVREDVSQYIFNYADHLFSDWAKESQEGMQNEYNFDKDFNLKEILNFIPEDVFLSIVRKKDVSWSCEKEWRLCKMCEEEDKKNVQIETAKPISIYLGEHIDPCNKIALIVIARIKGIPVYKMESVITSDGCQLEPKCIEMTKEEKTPTEKGGRVKEFMRLFLDISPELQEEFLVRLRSRVDQK